jgi:hypothetical protein
VPTIALEGDANGAPHPDASAYASKFPGTYAHRGIKGGVGHNLPQEAPRLKLFNASSSVPKRLSLVSSLAKFDIPTLDEMMALLGHADSKRQGNHTVDGSSSSQTPADVIELQV